MTCLRVVMIVLSLFAMQRLVLVQAAEPQDPSRLIIHDDFEIWSWEPITFGMRASGRKRLQAGQSLPFEHRGPLYRRAKGFALPSGRRVAGSEALEGHSVLLQDCQIGLHGRYSFIIRPATKYRYEVSLKGSGTFHFRAWVGATNPTTGEFRWLGFPNLIKLPVTESWQTERGEFQLPEFDVTTFKVAKVSCAIVVEEADRILVDNFSIWSLAAP